MTEPPAGILLIDKPSGITSFRLVSLLRKLTGVKKIGHTGTLDPLATGVMVMLIGKNYTKLSETLMAQDKQYLATLCLGITTDSYDSDGEHISKSDFVPSLQELKNGLQHFQGTVLQTPPMFSAKKIHGKKLYDLARKGIEVERKPVPVELKTELVNYAYPFVELRIDCSKGTYIRSVAHELGKHLGCGAHLSWLVRTRSGIYHLKDCWNVDQLRQPGFDWNNALKVTL